MTKSNTTPDDKELLVELIESLNGIMTLKQRTVISRLVGRIIDSFELELSATDFKADRRFTEGVMGRRPEMYFMSCPQTGEYREGSIKEFAETLECTPASIYIALRRAAQNGEDFTYRKNKEGHQVRICPITSDEERQYLISIAEQHKREFEAFKKRKEQVPYANEDGSY